MNALPDIGAEATRYVRDNAKKIIEQYADDDLPVAANTALTIFLAGSPGAGKTETTKDLLRTFKAESQMVNMIVRIDPDLIREDLPHYAGGNAHLFQEGVTVAADKIYNHCIKKNKHLIFDSTLAIYDKARQNVSKALKKNRAVFIVYVYQDPLIAWEFTQAREAKEGRRITKEAFVDRLLGARETVHRITEEFGDAVTLMVLDHNLKTDYYQWHLAVKTADFDRLVKVPYSKEYLMNKL